MPNKTFLVSGFGRSGTMWLAQLADRSLTWAVGHEPGPETHADAIRARFSEFSGPGNYGEVNSLALPAFWRVPVDRRAVILRCPRQLIVSAVRQGHAINDMTYNHLNAYLGMIDAAVECGVRVVAFHRMVTEIAYTAELLLYLGVDDVAVTQADIDTPVNASPNTTTWQNMGTLERRGVCAVTDWFTIKYDKHLDTVPC